VGNPQFGGIPPAGDTLSAAAQGYQAQLANQASQNALAGNIIGALGSIGGAFIGGPAGAMAGGAAGRAISDENAKEVTGPGERELEDFLHSAEGSARL
jgi:hypothetical protein